MPSGSSTRPFGRETARIGCPAVVIKASELEPACAAGSALDKGLSSGPTYCGARVGIGSIALGRDQINASRRVADTVLPAIAADPQVDVAAAEDVRSRVVLAELRATSLPAFDLGVGPVQALLEHDRRRGTEQARTMPAWLDAFGEARTAASVLFVHENTLRYRVRTISERFGIDLDDPHVRLVTWLELRLRS